MVAGSLFLVVDFSAVINAEGRPTIRVSTCPSDLKRNNDTHGDYKMTRNDFYEKLHKKNEKAFSNLCKLIARGFLRIVDIRIDTPEFGNQRVTIFLHETKE